MTLAAGRARMTELHDMLEKKSIKPSELAFDIDGVVADTMSVFIDLARERYGLTHLTKEHLSCYNLYQCLDLDRKIIDDLVCLTLDDEHTKIIPPMPGAVDVLTEIARETPLHFITARIWPESIVDWLRQTLPHVPPSRIQVVATGAPEAKKDILRSLNVKYFVEDRLETCRLLLDDGIQPLLFDQPWNRSPQASSFPRLEKWADLRMLIAPQNGNGH